MKKIAITIDQEWVPYEVTEWLIHELDNAGVKATFFATDEPVHDFGQHEAALHPNPYRTGSYDFITEIERLLKIYPDAKGIRMHRLMWDSALEGYFRGSPFTYASNFMIPGQLVQPFRLGSQVVHYPVFYMDHVELVNPNQFKVPFSLESLDISADGLYVFDFHPNLLFPNAYSEKFYHENIMPVYHNYQALKDIKHNQRGCLDLFRAVLALKGTPGYTFVTLGEEAGSVV